MIVNPKRVRKLQDGAGGLGPVVYWMSRDQRAHDNWALLFARELAEESDRGLVVVFSLVNDFLQAGLRQYDFLLKGLQETEQQLQELSIPFFLLPGNPPDVIGNFCKEYDTFALVSEFDPLIIKRTWKRDTAKQITVPFYEVDAHNIVPALIASSKREFGAYTLRPKIHKLLPEFLEPFPRLQPVSKKSKSYQESDWEVIAASLRCDRTVAPVTGILPGTSAALSALELFVSSGLTRYNELRNDPNADAQSRLSPYLHYGQLSAQRVAIAVRDASGSPELKEAFLEELIVRRELSDNFCYYNTAYDRFEGFPDWAKTTLNAHRGDKREYLYALNSLEHAITHDPLWNAAQSQMLRTGTMHGYMRMYWAKKILEWSESPEQAMEFAVYLNDRWQLDGRDPNGYTGCAWSIGGVHDRAWGERPVFGKIRYMNAAGCARKFDVKSYISAYSGSLPGIFTQ